MGEIEDLKADISKLQERNRRVESDKAWETSLTRRLFIAIGIYLIVMIVFLIINAPYPYLAGIGPMVGFILSSLADPPLKQIWLKSNGRNSGS